MSNRNSWEEHVEDEPPFVNLLPEDPGGPEGDRNEYGRGYDAGFVKGYSHGYQNGVSAARSALQEHEDGRPD